MSASSESKNDPVLFEFVRVRGDELRAAVAAAEPLDSLDQLHTLMKALAPEESRVHAVELNSLAEVVKREEFSDFFTGLRNSFVSAFSEI